LKEETEDFPKSRFQITKILSSKVLHNLVKGELSILKQLGNFLRKNNFGKIGGKLLFPLSKMILFLCLPSQNTTKHAHFQHSFLCKTENNPDTSFILKVIQNKLIK
jgi:hypothetical protein